MIDLREDNVTFVVQGPFKARTDDSGVSTLACLSSIRRLFPKAGLIYSASDTTQVSQQCRALVDILCQPKDPSQVVCGYVAGVPKPENVNRQIVGTIEGLKQVQTSYAIKIRSDFALSKPRLLQTYRRLGNRPAQRFRQPVVIISTLSRYCFKDQPFRTDLTSFHLSDLFFFGLTPDLLAYWDGPLVEPDNRQFSSSFFGVGGYPTVEQRLTRRFYARFDLCAYEPERVTTSGEEMLRYLDAVAEDFLILSAKELGLALPPRFKALWYNESPFLNERNVKALRAKLALSTDLSLGVAGFLRDLNLVVDPFLRRSGSPHNRQ